MINTKMDSMGCSGDKMVVWWGKCRQVWDVRRFLSDFMGLNVDLSKKAW